MAFVRTKDVYSHKYYQLVESYREEGRVHQRVLAHLGESPSLAAAIDTAAEEVRGLREKRQALLDERAGILEELHEKLPNIMGRYNGVPPNWHSLPTSRELQYMEYGRESHYGGFYFDSSYSRPPTAYRSPDTYYGYYGFMGICGRYHRIPGEVEALDERIARAEARLERLEKLKSRA